MSTQIGLSYTSQSLNTSRDTNGPEEASKIKSSTIELNADFGAEISKSEIDQFTSIVTKLLEGLEKPVASPDVELNDLLDKLESDLPMDITELIFTCMRLFMKTNQDMRSFFMQQANTQRTTILEQAVKEKDLAIAAATNRFASDLAGAISEIVGGVLQGGMAGKGFKDLGKSAKISNGVHEMRGELQEFKKLAKETKSSLDSEITSLRADLKSISKSVAKDPNIDESILKKKNLLETSLAIARDQRKTLSNTSGDAAKKLENEITTLETKVQCLQKLGDLYGRCSSSGSQILTGIGHLIGACFRQQASELDAEAKYVGTLHEVARMAADQFLDLANNAREMVNDMRNTEQSIAQTNLQAIGTMARNV